MGTIASCAIIGKQPALDFRHNLCIVAHTISKLTIGLICAPHKIRFFNFQETNRVSYVCYQTQIFHTYTRNRAQRGLVDAKISTEINVPLQRRPRFKIGRLGLRGGAISALAVDQGSLGGPETPIRARKGTGLAEISAI